MGHIWVTHINIPTKNMLDLFIIINSKKIFCCIMSMSVNLNVRDHERCPHTRCYPHAEAALVRGRR